MGCSPRPAPLTEAHPAYRRGGLSTHRTTPLYICLKSVFRTGSRRHHFPQNIHCRTFLIPSDSKRPPASTHDARNKPRNNIPHTISVGARHGDPRDHPRFNFRPSESHVGCYMSCSPRPAPLTEAHAEYRGGGLSTHRTTPLYICLKSVFRTGSRRHHFPQNIHCRTFLIPSARARPASVSETGQRERGDPAREAGQRERGEPAREAGQRERGQPAHEAGQRERGQPAREAGQRERGDPAREAGQRER